MFEIKRGTRFVQCLRVRGLTRSQIRAKARRSTKGHGMTPDDMVLFASEAFRIPPHIFEKPFNTRGG